NCAEMCDMGLLLSASASVKAKRRSLSLLVSRLEGCKVNLLTCQLSNHLWRSMKRFLSALSFLPSTLLRACLLLSSLVACNLPATPTPDAPEALAVPATSVPETPAHVEIDAPLVEAPELVKIQFIN